ncbi:hypothetical protein CMV_004568 [Castanea mollissima]|uniref:F-box protein n=1 Tax=Castanea mollissima TaxID=60419 RepID=A0A8J4W267_9ROSI|nr:hypothetical protein CMV_004568 [Castanea mollissima]
MKGQKRESMQEEKEEERRSERQRRERAERAERRNVVRARPCSCGGSSSLSSSSSSADDYKDVIGRLPDCLLIHILSFLPNPSLSRHKHFIEQVEVSLETRPSSRLGPALAFYSIRHRLPRPNEDELKFQLPGCSAMHLNPPPASASASASTFPSLRTLALGSVRYAKHDSISTLLAACPVLQDLSLLVESYNFHGLGESAGKINTPAFERFDFLGGLGEYVVLENLRNLVETVIELEDDDSVDYTNRIWDFMESLYNVVSMKFNLETARILCYGPMDGLPMFNNLTSLTFDGNIWPSYYMWPAVQLLLCQAPKGMRLKNITFESRLDTEIKLHACKKLRKLQRSCGLRNFKIKAYGVTPRRRISFAIQN